jgi:phage gp29-like protein
MADDKSPLPPFTKGEKPTTDEIATNAKDIDIFAGWLSRLENPDPVLRTEAGGKGLKLYDEVARDPHAGSVLQTRALAVTGKEWVVEPADESARSQEIADFVREALEKCNFDQARQELLKGILYGFYVGEVIWAVQNGRYVPAKIRAKHPRRFVFDTERRLRLLTPSNMIDGEEVPERKFIVFTYGSSDNPYGDGLGQKLWWPVWFKKNGVKFWLVFLEKFGQPTPLGKYPPGTPGPQQQALLDALDAIQTDSGVKIPDNMQIEFLEAARSGNATYQGLCDYMDRAVSKAVLGQTLTTEIKGEGSFAASKTHDEVRGEVTKADADLLCECLNQSLVRWIVDLNFAGVTDYPQVWVQTEEGEDLKERIEVDKGLVKEIGLPVAKKYFYETYGVPEPQKGEEVVAPPQPPPAPALPQAAEGKSPLGPPFGKGGKNTATFSDGFPPLLGKGGRGDFTPEQQALESLADQAAAEAVAALAANEARFDEAVQTASSYEEAIGNLLALFPALNVDSLTSVLERSLFAAHMHGRATTRRDDG